MPECELHITGNKGDKSLLERYSTTYSNIYWHKQLPFEEYLELLHGVTFQLSTRDARYPENQCNFPSKIIEALFHNRIVISTIHYTQIEGINYFEVHSDKDSFIRDVMAIIEMTNDKLLTYANQGERVKAMFGIDVWGKTMKKIETLDIR